MPKYKLSKGFITEKIDNKITIFDTENSQLLTFNKTASIIFDYIKKGQSKKEIVEKLQKKYKVPKTTASKDFDDLMVDLKKMKILHI